MPTMETFRKYWKLFLKNRVLDMATHGAGGGSSRSEHVFLYNGKKAQILGPRHGLAMSVKMSKAHQPQTPIIRAYSPLLN